MMLDYLQLPEHAVQVRSAVRATLSQGKSLTPDLGGDGTMTSFTRALVANL